MASNTTKAWKTAAYIRLSREDADTRSGEKAESESVVNQQQIIGDFIASQPDLGRFHPETHASRQGRASCPPELHSHHPELSNSAPFSASP